MSAYVIRLDKLQIDHLVGKVTRAGSGVVEALNRSLIMQEEEEQERQWVRQQTAS